MNFLKKDDSGTNSDGTIRSVDVSHVSQEDLDYTSSLSAAVLQQTRKKSRAILWFWVIAIVFFFTVGLFN
jgi:hypothetical protein